MVLFEGVSIVEEFRTSPLRSVFHEKAGKFEDLSCALLDRYRCPEDYLKFVLAGQLSSDKGYFRFGPDVCFGRTCRGERQLYVEPPLYDVLDDVAMPDANVYLQFDPTEIIDNLRLERYADAGSKDSFRNILKKCYYAVRSAIPSSLRLQVQRFHARHWKELPFPQWPVDTTVENICERLMLLSLEAGDVEKIPFVWFWPRGARGCLMMTHDVETEAGRDFCTNLMAIDEAFGIRASFQIVPEKRYPVPVEFLKAITSRGFEVAVQDLNHDGRLFDDKDEFLRRATSINYYGRTYGAKGFRAAVLYRKPAWYEALDFSFDMSMPNVGHLDPQRGGCCTVMPYFIGKILELPATTIQDYMLLHLLNERSIDLWKLQADLILKKNGLISFIVHPDYVMDPDTRTVYESLLAYLQDLRVSSQIWHALPSEIDGWWRERSQMRIQKCGDSWTIEGKGAERATLAYAKNVNGKLVYEMDGQDGTY